MMGLDTPETGVKSNVRWFLFFLVVLWCGQELEWPCALEFPCLCSGCCCVLPCFSVIALGGCGIPGGGRTFSRSAKYCVSVCLDPPPYFPVGCCYVAGFAGDFNV